MKIIGIVIALIVLFIIGAVLAALYRTFKVEHSPNQEKFVQGTADTSALNGDFRGSVTGYRGSWQGKTFQPADSSGINRFQQGETVTHNYPFKTYQTKGLRDQELEVIKLDYNQPGNPWWLTFIVDEIVRIAPDTYLGKVHLRLAPGVVFTVGYFTLEK